MITAWNANALFICLKLASAVAAGCTVVIKPSEMSSLQARVLVEALHEAGLPKGVLNVVTGLGTTVGAELVRNPDVDKISFTGSVGVGEHHARQRRDDEARDRAWRKIAQHCSMTPRSTRRSGGLAGLHERGRLCRRNALLLVPKSYSTRSNEQS
jgi:delta 1-pyrroline-5-carboxylate dehydrogenase